MTSLSSLSSYTYTYVFTVAINAACGFALKRATEELLVLLRKARIKGKLKRFRETERPRSFCSTNIWSKKRRNLERELIQFLHSKRRNDVRERKLINILCIDFTTDLFLQTIYFINAFIKKMLQQEIFMLHLRL